MASFPDNSATALNARRLLIAGFMAIFAAAMGAAIRAGVLDDWAIAFGFGNTEKRLISGAGFAGICLGLIVGGLVADRFQYGRMALTAFCLHVFSIAVPFVLGEGISQKPALVCLLGAAFLFAIASGLLMAVVNPLVATLYPNNRTHFLNMLNAAWPAGIVIGGIIQYYLGGEDWKFRFVCSVAPIILYGVLFLRQKFPRSEAGLRGFRIPQMLSDVGILGSAAMGFFTFLFFNDALRPWFSAFPAHADFFNGFFWFCISAGMGIAVTVALAGTSRWIKGAPLLLLLLLAHALVGVVDLGTEDWIRKFEAGIFDRLMVLKLFFYVSSLIFAFRFCGNFLQRKLKLTPISLLLICSVLTAIGLNFIGMFTNVWLLIAALTVYAIGVAFLWPTLLAVAYDRFPRCGALGISLMAALGIMSAMTLGSAGLGYGQDRFAAEALMRMNPGIYMESQGAPNHWLGLPEIKPIDAQKLDAAAAVVSSMQTPSQQIMLRASAIGYRKTLRVDSCVAAAMALIFLGLWIYFKSKGGYEPVRLTGGGVGRRESVR